MNQIGQDIEHKKRIIILSLQPSPYNRIINGSKKFEYRRKFLYEPVSAFIYVSSPIKEIRGYIEFGQPIFDRVEEIGMIAEQEGLGGAEEINKYMYGLEKGFAIPILSIQEIKPLTLEELKIEYNFTAPQSYINIDTIPKLKKVLLQRLEMKQL